MAVPLENTNALKHGGERAVKQLERGDALTGPAGDMERTVRTELETEGRAEIVTKAAVRLEAVARLFYGAFIDAAEKGDLKRMDSYVKRFGWLQTAALRAWAQVREERQESPNVLDYEQLLMFQDDRENGS